MWKVKLWATTCQTPSSSVVAEKLLRLSLLLLMISNMSITAETKVVAPSNVVVAGPYSPGLMVNGFLYLSGQGPTSEDGKVEASFAAQMRQTLQNVKIGLASGGLTMGHVVYAHVYLTDMANYDEMNSLWKEAFPQSPPARAVLGVHSLPGNGMVEVTAVAFEDLAHRSIINISGYAEPTVSPAVVAGQKVFLSGFLGVDENGKVPADPKAQVECAFSIMQRTLAAAHIDFRHVAFVNPYQTERVTDVMNDVYASHFEFGNTPARATIRAKSLPFGANIEFTGVAVSDLTKRHAVRPKNMPPSPTASPCVWADDTFYCSAKSAFIPGPTKGIYASTVEEQVRMSVRNLLDGLEEANLKLSNVIATNVYLDDMNDFGRMNRIYAQYFPGTKPTRTTVAQLPPVTNRKPTQEDIYPLLEQISLIAVR